MRGRASTATSDQAVRYAHFAQDSVHEAALPTAVSIGVGLLDGKTAGDTGHRSGRRDGPARFAGIRSACYMAPATLQPSEEGVVCAPC